MARNMTQGGVTGHLAAYTVPLVLGNLFQLTYNAVDSIVIDRYSGKSTLAAVGTADPVMNLLIFAVSGVCLGAGVLMSNFFGAGNTEKLRRELGTTLAIGGVFSGAVFLLALLSSEGILRLMQTPEGSLADAVVYLRVVLLGMPFTCLYNIYAAAMRSVGDSRTPVWFLAAASVLNGALDVLFVGRLGMGAFGAALATDIAQSLSAGACILYVRWRVPLLRIAAADLKPDRALLRQTLQYGLTTALQQSSQPIGKLFIQGVVNTLDIDVVAAYIMVGKIEEFALMPERSISAAMTTFIAQNDGAGDRERVRQGAKRGLALEMGYFLVICAVVLLFHKPVLAFFSTDEMVRQEGARYFSRMAFFYSLSALTNGAQGVLRGLKYMRLSLAGSVTQISLRVLLTFLLAPRMGIRGIAYGCAVGWASMLVVVGVCLYLRGRRRPAV